jgi:hypothetical protein
MNDRSSLAHLAALAADQEATFQEAEASLALTEKPSPAMYRRVGFLEGKARAYRAAVAIVARDLEVPS